MTACALPVQATPQAPARSSGETLHRRARSMYFSKPLATRLAEVAKDVGSPLEKSYRNTVYCNATLLQSEGRIVGTYCGNRWCLTCARIRTALAIQRYRPALETWGDLHFVTLTLRNCPAAQLGETIDAMLGAFTAAKRAIKRTDRVPFRALRKLECTYNAATDEYHPHFHVQVEGRRAAELLVSRWLEQFPDRTDPKGQDVRAADSASLGELFKYFTKLVTRQKMMPAVALDVIFRAMRGRRVYQPVGFVVPKDAPDDDGELAPDEGTEAVTRPGESIAWEWRQEATDWVDPETGECLTGYEPAERFRTLVESIATGAAEAAPREPRRLPAEARRDVGELRAGMRRRFLELERQRAPVAPVEEVAATVRRLLVVSDDRARVLAHRLTGCDVGAQVALFSADTLSALRRPRERPS